MGLIEIKVKLTAILILTFSEICMKNCPRILVKPTQLSFLSIFSKIHLRWDWDNFLYHSIQLNSTDSNHLYSLTKIYQGTSWLFGNQSTGSIDVFVGGYSITRFKSRPFENFWNSGWNGDKIEVVFGRATSKFSKIHSRSFGLDQISGVNSFWSTELVETTSIRLWCH